VGSTHRFLAIGEENEIVLDWFRSLPSPPWESPAEPRGRCELDTLRTLRLREVECGPEDDT